MAQQHRKTERIPVATPVVVKEVGQPPEALPDVAWVRDLSSGGVYLVFDHELAVGTPLDLVFTLPRKVAGKEVLVRCRGQVVRVEHRETAVGVGAVIEDMHFLKS